MNDVVVPLLSIFAPLLVILLIHRWKEKNKKRLLWRSYPPEAVLQIANDVKSEISIKFREEEIQEASRFRFALCNVGRTPLLGSDIVSPLTWVTDRRVLGVTKQGDQSPVEMSLCQRDNSIVISWDLFNQGCNFSFNVICEGPPTQPKDSIEYQIKGVNKIEEEILTSEQANSEQESLGFKIIDYIMALIAWTALIAFFFSPLSDSIDVRWFVMIWSVFFIATILVPFGHWLYKLVR